MARLNRRAWPFWLGRFGDHVFESSSGRNHGEDVLVLDALRVNEDGAVIVGEGFFNLARDIGGALDVDAWDVVGSGQLAEVGVAEEVDTGLAVVEEEFLPLANHAEVVVVENHDLDGELVNLCGGQFEESHLETSVTGDGDNTLVGLGELGADGSGEAEAHGAGSSGGKPVVGLVVLVELGGPHLVLADVGRDDGFAFGLLVEFVNDLLHAEATLLAKRKRELLLVAIEVGEPLGGFERLNVFDELGEGRFGIADDLNVGTNHLVHLGGVDVDVDDLGALAELLGVADDAVVEAGTDMLREGRTRTSPC